MGDEERPKRGRPPGSISLTPEIEMMILSYIRAGAPIKEAAEAAGVPLRTLTDWLARGSGNSSRPATPKLRRFAAKVEKARAEVKVAAFKRGYDKDPWAWLKRMASSSFEQERQSDSPSSGLSEQEVTAELGRAMNVWLEMNPTIRLTPCSHPRCRCEWHRDRS